jgi:hypothetical protein
MKVLDLHCQQAHCFEGWFGSEDDFQSQLARGLVQCPMCGDAAITKKLSAPRLNLLGSRATASTQAASEQANQALQGSVTTDKAADTDAAQSVAVSAPATPVSGSRALSPTLQAMVQDPQFQAAYLHMARSIMANTEDVGSQFAQEARKMHYGETDERAIRGQATRDEALELLDEGIDVLPLVLPDVLKGTLQ